LPQLKYPKESGDDNPPNTSKLKIENQLGRHNSQLSKVFLIASLNFRLEKKTFKKNLQNIICLMYAVNRRIEEEVEQ